MPSIAVNESEQRFGPPEWGMSVLVALIWGSSFLWIAIAIDHVSTTVVPLARCLFGAAALALLRGAAGRRHRPGRRGSRRGSAAGQTAQRGLDAFLRYRDPGPQRLGEQAHA